MENDDDKVTMVFTMLVFILGFFTGIIGGTISTTKIWKQRVIDHNAAHYTINEKTGKQKFEWIEKSQVKEGN
jgi:hypothetical protein